MARLLTIISFIFLGFVQNPGPTYKWKASVDPTQSLLTRIPVPAGYERIAVEPGSFGAWLRNIPLKPGKPDVKLHSGKLKANQAVHHAVIDIDTGKKDLQQCADAVIRLRAEYLYSIEHFGNIHFNFTSGFWFGYLKYAEGSRVKVTGNKVDWILPAAPRMDLSYENFKKYLENAFTYAGTLSLSNEMNPADIAGVNPGDVFIHGGAPGHAVIVMDVAVNAQGKRIFILAQSYMPAQDMHILVNSNDSKLSPWYSADFDVLRTPEWTFARGEFMTF